MSEAITVVVVGVVAAGAVWAVGQAAVDAWNWWRHPDTYDPDV